MCITVFTRGPRPVPCAQIDRAGKLYLPLLTALGAGRLCRIFPLRTRAHIKKDQTENTKMHSRPLRSFNLILPALPVTRHHILLRCHYFNTFFITFQHFFYVFLRLFYDDWFKLFYWGFHFLSKMIQTIFVPDFLTDWFTCSHGLYSKCKILNC